MKFLVILLISFILFSISGYIFAENSDEVRRWYYEHGELKDEAHYQNNMRQGPHRIFYKDGSLKEEWIYDVDMPISAKFYYKSGGLKSEWLYKNGQLNGSNKMYYESGALWREQQWLSNQPHGISKMYYESGKLWLEARYEKGVLKEQKRFGQETVSPDGIRRIYYQNGALLAEERYGGKGKFISGIYYYQSGLPMTEVSEGGAALITHDEEGSVKKEPKYDGKKLHWDHESN